MTKRLVSHDDEKFGTGLPDVVEDGIIGLIRNNSPEQGSSVGLVTTEEEFDTFKSEAIDGDMAVVDIENRPNAIYIHDGTPEGYVKEFATAIARYEEQTGQNSWASFAKEGDIAIGTMGGNTYLTQRGATSSNRHNIQLTGGGVASGEVTDAITPNEKIGDRVVKTSEDGFLHVPTPTSGFHASHKKYVDDQTAGAVGHLSEPNTLVRTNAYGHITSGTPTVSSHVANKGYVDNAISGLDISTFNWEAASLGNILDVEVNGVRIEKLVIVSVAFRSNGVNDNPSFSTGVIPNGFRPKNDVKASVVDRINGNSVVVGLVTAERGLGTLSMAQTGRSGRANVTLTWTV